MSVRTYVDQYGYMFHIFDKPFQLEEPPMTEYVVFHLTEKEDWEFCGTAEARSSHAAITAVINGPVTTFERAGQFVATPKRSWQPVRVEVETKTALKFS